MQSTAGGTCANARDGGDLGWEFDPERIGPVCLVTGGSGYLGHFLIRRLCAIGCRVRSFDTAAPAQRDGVDDSVERIAGDIRRLSQLAPACEGVDTVFHTAALINLLALYRPKIRRTVFDVNVLGSEHVIRACREAAVGKLIHTSTINVAMGAAVRDGDESTRYVQPGDLLDLYGETKAAAEQRVLAADAPGGLRTAALRPGGIWGPGEGSMMISVFLEQLAHGRFKALVGDGRAAIDNTHVENAVDAHLLAAEKLGETPETVGGQAYFITDGEPMNGLEWFRPLVEGLGHPWPRRRLPARLAYALAHALELVHFLGGPEPSLTRRGVANLTRDARFRIDKARAQLGYRPRVQSADGLRALLPELRAMYQRIAAS